MKRAPLPARTKPIPRGSPPAKKRAKPRRVSVLRCRKYLDWPSAECRCVVCRIAHTTRMDVPTHSLWMLEFIDPAHGPVNGGNSKGPDNEAIALCRFHHNEMESLRWPAFQEQYGFERAAEADALYAR